MSPTCSKAALRVLASVLLATSVADAAVLRHQVLDTRDAAQQQNAQIAADAIQAAASVIAENPTNFFEDISDDLKDRSAWSLIQDFFERLFAPRQDSNGPAVTISVTPTPGSVETASVSLTLPSGPSEVASSVASSTTSAPDDIMSILPVGSLTTAINATFLTPVFSTASEETPVATSSVIEIIAPFPVLNATGSAGIFPTAISVTGDFSVTMPLSTGAPAPEVSNSGVPALAVSNSGVPALAVSNSSVPTATLLAPAFNFTATFPALDPSLVTGGYHPTGISNATAAPLNGTANVTSTVVVTATVTPIPVALITGTGTAVVSAGTGLPIVIIESPIWSNSTHGEATAVAPILGTGTGSPILPSAVPIPSGGYAYSKPSDLPAYPNVTTATPVPLPFPISVITGIPEPVNVTLPANVTSAAEPVQVVFDPPAVTGIPGNVISIVIPLPVFPNTTSSAEVVTSAAPSVGYGLPVPVSIEAPTFVNTTTATLPVVETATAVLILPPPIVTGPVVEVPDSDPALLSLRTICENPAIHTLTLPLLSAFYGPSNYPSLHPFPGCTAPNARQSASAPGLLDCSALSIEVQSCQSRGVRVLLSIKADGLGVVGGNAAYGDLKAGPKPLGPVFSAKGLVARQEMKMPEFHIPGVHMGHGPVVVNVTRPRPIAVVEPLLISVSISKSSPTSSPTSTSTSTPSPLVLPVPAGPAPPCPNLFDANHTPSALALTLFSLFGEGHTERADLRPLGPGAPSGASPESLNGTDWINPILTELQRPLGEEVVVDGFDVQVPADWEGTYQDTQFKELMKDLKGLHEEAWKTSGGVEGGKDDLGADGKGVVYFGWIGGALSVRSKGLKVRADLKRVGWVEWSGRLTL